MQFSDFYIKPNYSAHLTDLSGSVSALSATQAGKVEVAARVENIAPVEVHNPFARELSLDLTAKATGVDLPPLTTYSGKYAGYGITKGALSAEVHYKIENRRLTASNQIVLDQLTFGERVDSPTATKLPILLAVALLKDGNGTIRLDLPIQGSLDDPEFSVWGVVVQIIVNLIAKAATAVCADQAIVGGAATSAFVEFAPGRALFPNGGAAAIAPRPRSPCVEARRGRTRAARCRSRRTEARCARSRDAGAEAEGPGGETRVGGIARGADDRRHRISDLSGSGLRRHEAAGQAAQSHRHGQGDPTCRDGIDAARELQRG